MLRAAAKNHRHVTVISSKSDYKVLENILDFDNGETSLELRRSLAIKAFDVCTAYDMAISNYFNHTHFQTPFNKEKKSLRYGENPHQKAVFYGDLNEHFFQLHGKELSYNNLVDVDAAVNLINEFSPVQNNQAANTNYTFAIIKHTNVCGIASAGRCSEAWKLAHAGDPESAFGGVLICNGEVDVVTANFINDLFFEVMIAPSFNDDALEKLKSKKNRILLQLKNIPSKQDQSRNLLNGLLTQQPDTENYSEWKEEGGRITTTDEKASLIFANIVCKNLKSNAIALVKGSQLIGKGCGQTSRIDALRHAIDKAKQFSFRLDNAVLASDAFFPFDDCVRIAHQEGITAFIQPGGSVRDIETLNYSKENNLAMVLTGMRHFKH
jgi:phosphoribosylaminoimidazolecarboxamide formyltransferase/IMP cyclohydrolase